MQAVAGKYAGTGSNQNHVRSAIHVKGAANPKRRLGVRVRNNGPSGPTLEPEVKTRVAADLTRFSQVS
jgi:hypothetical protein